MATKIKPSNLDFTTLNIAVSNTGNVGIGTTSPASIVGGTDTSPVLSIGGTDSTLTTGDKSGSLSFKTNDTSYTGTYADGVTAEIASVATTVSGAAYGLAFYTGTTADTNRGERLRIDASGNVGIGTTTPTETLQVVGNLLVGVDSGDPFSTGAKIRVQGIGAEYVQIKSDGTGSVGLILGDTTDDFTAGVLSDQTDGANLLFYANNEERMRIDSAGKVGIGMTPTGTLSIRPSGTGSEDSHIGYGANLDTYITTGSDGVVIFREGNGAGINTERMRIDSAGNVGIGTTAPATKLEIASSVMGDNFIRLNQNADPNAYFGAPIGRIQMNWIGDPNWASINFEDERAGAGGTHKSGISFTTRDGNNAGAERMRITSAGAILVGATSISTTSDTDTGFSVSASGTGTFARSGNFAIVAMRQTNDGTIISLRQAGVEEGTISVSGTTVSYNGGHLSRWAQFPDNSRPELLKGTVMSNLDQMSNWDNEENEQLNCVQVSTVEGDANVAGVFVTWDSTDDGYNDILLAMTGDMVIRIGAGVTVARGDLLMSAGDGTAKPQGDDIVRSKTIAKVTSIHVSHTYADGSYAIPCVLMAC